MILQLGPPHSSRVACPGGHVSNGAAALDSKRWYDWRRSGIRAGVWRTRRPIEPQSRMETLKTHCHGHQGDADGSAGIRTAVDHL